MTALVLAMYNDAKTETFTDQVNILFLKEWFPQRQAVKNLLFILCLCRNGLRGRSQGSLLGSYTRQPAKKCHFC
jgi:hypothetical protein